MANRIAIPKLAANVTPLRLPEFDTELNPFAPIAEGAEKIGNAIEAREKKDLRDKQEAEAQRLAALARQQNAPAQPPGAESADSWSSPPDDPIERERWMQEEARRLREGRDSSSLDTAARSIRLVSVDPNQVGTYREELDQALSVLPEDDQETRAKARRLFSIAYFRALIEQNPKLALETLRSRKGAAEEEWGIGEDVREDLEEQAQRALDAELARPSFEAHPWLFDSVVPRSKRAPERGGYVFEAWRDYGEAVKIYDIEPKAVPWVEAQIDKTIREAQRNRRSVISVGKSLLGEGARAWDGAAVQALDIHAKAVIGDDTWSPEARNRMVGLSRLAKRAPDVVREHIRSGVRSTDTNKRAFAGQVLVDLDRAGAAAGRDFLAWTTPDVRAFGRDFWALRQSGYSDTAAVKRIDDARSVTPAQRAARRRYFAAHTTAATLADAVRDAVENARANAARS